MSTTRSPRRRAAGVLTLGALVLAATSCGDDDDDGVAASTTQPAPVTSAVAGGEVPTVEVTAIDYGYEGLPASVPAGTPLSLVNASDVELHEIVAVRLPDGEDRSLSELLALPESELGPLFAGVTDVIVALPAATDAPGAVEGDGVLDEPGRYLLFCGIPVGADPAAYLEAAAAAEGGPPQGVEGGPPHFTQGMAAEVVVE